MPPNHETDCGAKPAKKFGEGTQQQQDPGGQPTPRKPSHAHTTSPEGRRRHPRGPTRHNHERDYTGKHAGTNNTTAQAETENAHSPRRNKRTKENEAERNPGKARRTGGNEKKRWKRKLHQNTNIAPRAKIGAGQFARRVDRGEKNSSSESNQ